MTRPDDVEHFDVVIAGAGIAGCSAAIALAQKGWRVALVHERKPIVETGETLPGAAKPLLEYLGVADRMGELGALRIAGLSSVWGAARGARNNILSAYGDSWIVHKGRFEQMLRSAAVAAGAIVVEGKAVLSNAPAGAGHPHHCTLLAVSSPISISARALIDATGRQAGLARRLGARRIVWDRLAAATWSVHEAEPSPSDGWGRATVHAHARGWWYAATLPDGGWALTAFYYPPRPGAGRPWWQGWDFATARALIGSDDVPPPTRPEHLSAASARLDRHAGIHWAAVGDAACAFDPLASAGMLMALRTALRAANAISCDLTGNPAPLRAYARMLGLVADEYSRRRQAVYADGQKPPRPGFWKSAAEAESPRMLSPTPSGRTGAKRS